MDQLVNRPATETPASVEAALGIDGKDSTRKRRRGWTITLACILLVGAGTAYFWSGSSTATVTYATTPAETGNLVVQVSATGTLQPLTQVDISSELSGVVRSVAVDENQTVRKGDVLAKLDTTRLSAQVERAEASAKAAQAKIMDTKVTLKETEQALTRAQQLSKRGMLADQNLEAAEAARDRAESAVASADANLAIAVAELKLQQADVEKSTIYAPIDGVVLTQ